jgi:hypothetical protein
VPSDAPIRDADSIAASDAAGMAVPYGICGFAVLIWCKLPAGHETLAA